MHEVKEEPLRQASNDIARIAKGFLKRTLRFLQTYASTSARSENDEKNTCKTSATEENKPLETKPPIFFLGELSTTYEVIVIFAKPLTLELWKNIEEEFKAIHDQTFKQEVDIRRQRDGTIRGTVKERRHGFFHGVPKEKKIVLVKCPKCNKEVGKPLNTYRTLGGRFTEQFFSCSNCNTNFSTRYAHVSRPQLLIRTLRRKTMPTETTVVWIDEDEENLEEIQIPCHSNYNHMVQTKKDIEAVLKKLGVTARSVEMSY